MVESIAQWEARTIHASYTCSYLKHGRINYAKKLPLLMNALLTPIIVPGNSSIRIIDAHTMVLKTA